jgi:hypothetical protein
MSNDDRRMTPAEFLIHNAAQLGWDPDLTDDDLDAIDRGLVGDDGGE